MAKAAVSGPRIGKIVTKTQLMNTAAVTSHPTRTLGGEVGVELVEDEEAETPGGFDELTLVGAREEQFEHHVVRQEDVRRRADDRLAVLVILLARVTGERHRALAVGEARR